jgi:hypothetical protein
MGLALVAYKILRLCSNIFNYLGGGSQSEVDSDSEELSIREVFSAKLEDLEFEKEFKNKHFALRHQEDEVLSFLYAENLNVGDEMMQLLGYIWDVSYPFAMAREALEKHGYNEKEELLKCHKVGYIDYKGLSDLMWDIRKGLPVLTQRVFARLAKKVLNLKQISDKHTDNARDKRWFIEATEAMFQMAAASLSD